MHVRGYNMPHVCTTALWKIDKVITDRINPGLDMYTTVSHHFGKIQTLFLDLTKDFLQNDRHFFFMKYKPLY